MIIGRISQILGFVVIGYVFELRFRSELRVMSLFSMSEVNTTSFQGDSHGSKYASRVIKYS